MATDLNSHSEDSNQGKSIPQEPGPVDPVRPSRTPFIKDLLSRRVPQILGGYLADRGKISEALVHLQKAQRVWEEADSNYTPATLAREKLTELEGSGG